MYCAVDLDTVAGNELDAIHAGLVRARDRGEAIHLYAHSPGRTVPLDKFEAVLADANDLGLPFVTYADLAAGVQPGAAVVLSFDDQDVDAWTALRPTFAAHQVRATFFVSRFYAFTAAGKAELHQLEADGHAIEAHTVFHLNAPDYVADRGLAAWLADEALPSIAVLTDDGFAPPVAFAYPFGARTSETDRAMLAHVPVLRSVAFAISAPVADACPE
ncbi:MAG: polysaccharide deacetylase family protein [Deltaproteobacteria bacterium]|nr:polysaccharide deacetylase family protein [Deltaproteobacteria bacterium]